MKKFRTVGPGDRAVHPGQQEQASRLATSGRTFGDVSGRGTGTTKDALDFSRSPMETYVTERFEQAVYKSRTREPLGKTYVHGAGQLPDSTRRPDFAFGNKSRPDEGAKGAIFPHTIVDPEEEKKEEVYQISHRTFPPGVQVRPQLPHSCSLAVITSCDCCVRIPPFISLSTHICPLLLFSFNAASQRSGLGRDRR